MNLLDYLILIPILFFCYRGFVNGIIQEVLSIVGIVLAVFLSFQYMDAVGSLIRPMFSENAGYIPFLSGALIFIGTVAAVQLIAFLTRKFLETVKLNFLNRLAGLGFGFLKSGIVISALLLILAGFNLPSQEARNNSVSYPYIIYLAPFTYDAVALIYPGAEYFTETVDKTLDRYNPIENFPTLDK